MVDVERVVVGKVERGVYTWLKIRSGLSKARTFALSGPPPRELSHQVGLDPAHPTSSSFPQDTPFFILLRSYLIHI